MSNDMNRVTLIGRLIRDPELRHTQGGIAIGNFSIANNKSYTTTGGEKKEIVSYFDCTAWGKLGEIIVEYGKKGRRIAIDGRLQQQRWTDKDGGNRSKVEIVVDTFQLLDGKKDSADEGTPPPATPDYEPPKTDSNPFGDDDIPF